jgi:hypothetical protein
MGLNFMMVCFGIVDFVDLIRLVVKDNKTDTPNDISTAAVECTIDLHIAERYSF